MCSKNDVKLILNELINSYKEAYGKNLVKIYLFGSYARGDYTEFSDLNIAAIVKADRRNVQDNLKKVWDKTDDLELEYEIIISPTAIPYDDFITYKNILPYYKSIEKEGILINESA